MTPRPAASFTAALLSALIVVDGDTVKLDGVRLRLVGIDAPEAGARAHCPFEAAAADRATARMAQIVDAGVKIEWTWEVDTWGRPLVRLRLPDGRDAGDVLVDEGLARVWTGRPEGWCG